MKKINSSIFAKSAVGEKSPVSSRLHFWNILFFWILIGSSSLSAQECPMGCADMNLSMDTSIALNGQVEVTPAMVMTDLTNCDPNNLEVKLFDQFGRPIPISPIIDCDYIGQQITVKVIETGSQNSCWSYINVEDKAGPNLNCVVDTIYCVELEKYEVGEDRFPFGMASDNCGVREGYPVNISMRYEEYDCDENAEFSGKAIRELFAQDSWGNSVTCTDTFYVARVPLDSIVCPTDTIFECCEADSLDLDGDGKIDPEFTGVPQVYIAEMDTLIDLYPGGNICKTYTKFKDHEWEICGKGRKVRRTWEIVDWCRDTTITCVQYIKIVDTLKPEIEKYADIDDIASPHECKAKVEIPYPTVIKECSGIEKVTVEISYYDHYQKKTKTEFKEIKQNVPTYIYPLAGCWDAYIYVIDSCGNTCIDTFKVCIKDDTPPTPVCDQYTQTTLDPNECWARIYATTFDDGSNDNCCPELHFSAAKMTDITQWRNYWKDAFETALGLQTYAKYRKDIEAWIEIWLDCNVFYDYVEFGDCADDNMVVTRVYSKCHIYKFYDPHLHGDSEHDFFCLETYKKSLGAAHVVGVKDINDLIDDTYSNNNFLGDIEGLVDSCIFYWSECMVEVDVDDKVAPVCRPHQDVTVYCDAVIQDPSGPSALLAACTSNTSAFKNCVDCPYWIELDGQDIRVDPTSLFKTPDYYDNCNDITVDSVTTGSLDDCGEGVLTRTWTIRDACGNSTSCSQKVYVKHRSDFEAKFPADTTIFCESNLAIDLDPDNIGRPIVTDDECEQIGMSYDDEVFTIVEDACLKIIRTWTIIDWCVYDPDYYHRDKDICLDTCVAGPDRPNINRSLKDNGDGHMKYTQIIKVRNQEAPELRVVENEAVCASNPETCLGNGRFVVEASDDCTPADEIEWDIYLDAFSEGNFAKLDEQVGAMATIDMALPVGIHKIRFVAEDKCGNYRDTTITFEIDLCKKPTPYCHSGLRVPLMGIDDDGDGSFDRGMVTIWAEDFDAGSFAYCDQDVVAFSFSADTTDKYREFTCDSLGTRTVEMWVTDSWGNQDFCVVDVVIQDNMGACSGMQFQTATVSGKVLTELNEEIVKVKVDMSGSGSQPIMTGNDGTFNFGSMVVGGAYSVKPEKDINHINGVSTLDLVLIQKHILGITPLNSPYRIIAADIDNNKSITALDLVQLRRLILGIDDEFTMNDSWRFVSVDYEFNDPRNPLGEQFMEEYQITQLQNDMEVNFVGIKVGDVNGTVSPSELKGAQVRSANELILAVDNINFSSNDILEVPVTAQNFNQIMGYQFTLEFDSRAVSLQEIVPGVLKVDDSNFGYKAYR